MSGAYVLSIRRHASAPLDSSTWAPLQSCWSAPFPQKRTTLQSTASSLRCSLTAGDSLEIGSSMAKDKTNSCEADPDVYGNAMICVSWVSVVVRLRGWMVQRRVPGCSVCESAHVHFFNKIPTIWTTCDKNKCVFHKIDFFDMPKNVPNSSEKQHRKKLSSSKRWT